jgi:hypothetical protein|tara:strand:- start:273 stop:653 length:381 start_codon:yes stop_codon:yes gene_type:complete
MTEKSFFDHLEVHVQDVPRYCDFLIQIFDGGEFRIIDDNGTSMFKSPESLFIEIKKKSSLLESMKAGFCQPCLRRIDAKKFIEQQLKCTIIEQASNEKGNVYFFKDHENITWHFKDYQDRDSYTNW